MMLAVGPALSRWGRFSLLLVAGNMHAQNPPPEELALPFGDFDGQIGFSTPTTSPMRISLAHELGVTKQSPAGLIKNRSSLRFEYSRTFDERLFVQFDGKATAFFGSDHRRRVESNDVTVSQAYLQTSFGQTSVRAGIMTLPWGESILAPITDEISPRDNRELFNFNLDELRIGQQIVALDHYLPGSQLGAFVVLNPRFNKSPADGSAYFFDPFVYRQDREGADGVEYGLSWKRSYSSADFTLMAANLIDNEYARLLHPDGTVSLLAERIALTGASFTRAFSNLVLRGEVAVKNGKPFNTTDMQIERKRTVEAYVGIDYRHSPSLTFATEWINQHIAGWDQEILGVARNRQTVMLSAEKLLKNDDISVTLQHFHSRPYPSNLTMLLTSWRVNDRWTLNLNLAVPSARNANAMLWNVRDQKQALFKVQYQF